MLSGSTFAEGVAITVTDPNGGQHASVNAGPNSTSVVDLAGLTVTGLYTITAVPVAGDSGQLALALFQDATAVLATDGETASLSLLAGQRGELTFNGVAGSAFGLGVSGLNTTPSAQPISLTLTDPSGAVLVTPSFSSAGSTALPQLSSSGLYTLRVEPPGATAAPIELALVPATQAAVTAGSTVTFSGTVVGAEGLYTFSAAAGDSWSVALSGSTFADTVTVSVTAPSGAEIGIGFAFPGASTAINLSNLSASGLYSIAVVPSATDTSQLTLQLVH